MSDTRLDKLQGAINSLLARGVRVRRREDVDTRPLRARPPHERNDPKRTILEHARWRQPVQANRLRVAWRPATETHCAYCNQSIQHNGRDSDAQKTRDHVVPGDPAGGFVAVCRRCNSAKGDLGLVQFLAARRWLQLLKLPFGAKGIGYWCRAHKISTKGYPLPQLRDDAAMALREVVETPAMLTAFREMCQGQRMKVEFNNPFFRVYEALRGTPGAAAVDIVAATGLSATSVKSTLSALEYSGTVGVVGRRGEHPLYQVLTKPQTPTRTGYEHRALTETQTPAKVEPMTQTQNTPTPAPIPTTSSSALVLSRRVGVAADKLSGVLNDVRAHKNTTAKEITTRTGYEQSSVYMALRALVEEGAIEGTRRARRVAGVAGVSAMEYAAVEGPFKPKRKQTTIAVAARPSVKTLPVTKAAAPFMARVQAAATKLKARSDRDELQALAAAQQALGDRLDELQEAVRVLTDAVLR